MRTHPDDRRPAVSVPPDTGPRPHPTGRPLVVTSDDELLDDVLRLAAAAGVEVEVATEPGAVRQRLATSSLVLLGADQVDAGVRARLPRRSDVVVVGRDEDPPWDGAQRLGAAQVAVLPAAESWLVERLATGVVAQPPAATVAVLGGRGGAGASVLAAGLAVTAANVGRRVLLVDADPLGGGLDLTLGWEDDDGVRWPELTGASGRLDAAALVGALPGRGELALLSFDRRDLAAAPATAMAAVIAAGRAARDLVVVDLPRHFDEGAVAALQAVDQALLVVPSEVRAATAAVKVAARAATECAQVRLVVRGPSPGRLTAEEISRSLGLPLAGAMRPEVGLPAALEGGLPPTATGRGPLAVLCHRLIDELVPSHPVSDVERQAA